METSKLLDAQFKIIRMLIELSKALNSMKKNQSEMKNTLIEIKNIYRESTVDYMK